MLPNFYVEPHRRGLVRGVGYKNVEFVALWSLHKSVWDFFSLIAYELSELRMDQRFIHIYYQCLLPGALAKLDLPRSDIFSRGPLKH